MLLWQLHGHPLLQPGFGLDTDLYVELARRVAAFDLALGPGAYPAAPLYIYVLGGVFSLTGGSLLAARVLQILLGTLAVWLIADSARRWYGDKAAVPAALLAAVCGPFAFNEVLILQSALDPVLVALALWQLTRALASEHGAAWFASGLAWAAVVLNRPNALPFLAVLAAGIVWSLGWRRGRKPLAAFAIGLALLMGPVAARNAAVTGELVLISSHGGFNFFVGNNADADGTYRSVAGVTPSSVLQARDARRVAEAAAGRVLGDGEVSDYFYERAWHWIRSSPADALALFARKLRYVISADEISLNYSYAYYSRDAGTVLVAMPVGPWLLLPLGLVGLLACAPPDRGYRLWASFVPAYAFSVALFFVSERYRLPMLVPLVASSAALLVRGAALAAVGAWRQLAMGAGAVAVAVFLTWWPTGLDNGRGEERIALAEAVIRAGDRVRGRQLVEEALAGHPQPALVLFRAGRASQAAGDRDQAIARYQQALARDPGRVEVRFFLGQCLLDQRRVGEAIPHLNSAVTSGIRLDVAPFDLARALASTGDFDAARRALMRLEIPQVADTASFLGAAQMAERLQDPALAIRFYAQVLERPDMPPPAAERLGVLLAMTGRAREAIAVLEAAARRAPREPSLHLNLAVALAQEGRLAEARQRVQEALRLRPDYPQAQALSQRLGGL